MKRNVYLTLALAVVTCGWSALALATNQLLEVTAKPKDNPQDYDEHIEGRFNKSPTGDKDEIHVTQPANIKGKDAGVYVDPVNDGADLTIVQISGPVKVDVEGREGVGAIYWVQVSGQGSGTSVNLGLWADVRDKQEPGALALVDMNSGRGTSDKTNGDDDTQTLYVAVADDDGKGDVEFLLITQSGTYDWTISATETIAASGTLASANDWRSKNSNLPTGLYTLTVTKQNDDTFRRNISIAVLTFALYAKGGGPAKPYGNGVQIENLLGIWPRDPITIEVRLTPPLPDPLPDKFIAWAATSLSAPPDNTLEATFHRTPSGTETISVTLPALEITKTAHINYPDVGTMSETPGLLLLDPYLYAAVGFYGLGAHAYASALQSDGMHPDKANAIQHAYWNAMIASDSSWTTEDALFATTAHEYSNKADGGLAFDTVSDLHNNAVGARNIRRNERGEIMIGQIKIDMQNKLNDGTLWRIDSSGCQVQKTNGTPIFSQ